MLLIGDFMYNQNELKMVVLSLINKEMTLSLISKLLDIDYNTIYKIIIMLKQDGFNISEKIYANGDIRYMINKNTKLNNHYKNIIITEPEENEIELLVTSDIHFGSNYENRYLLNNMIDYCLQNNLHIIINCGDFVEGIINLSNIKIPWDEQIYHAILEYPEVNDIITFLLLGNHDYSLINNFGQDIRTYIKNKRHDIIPLGYGLSNIKIKNDELILEHAITERKILHENYKNKIIMRGHGHEAKFRLDGVNYIINLPSLSDLNFNKSSFPGMLKLKLQFLKGNINNIIVEQLSIINNNVYTTGEYKVFTGRGKSYKEDTLIENEEYYIKEYKKVR